jgi:pimeloyl-ACP methyl ester carboxylesterase
MLGRILLGAVALLVLLAVGGYLLLQRPPETYARLDADYASPASKFIDMGDGVEMHYRIEGNPAGRTLLLVHGFSASLHTWEKWVGELGGEYRMVSLDLPGHGLTRTPASYAPTNEAYADLVEAFAKKLSLGKVTVIGSSMGGAVAWHMALRHPERLEAMVLVDAAGWPDARIDNREEPAIFKMMRNPVIGPILRRLDTTPAVRQGLQASFANPALVDDAMVQRYVRMSRAPGHGDALLAIMTGERTIASKELLAGVKTPTLILQGRKDNLVPAEAAVKFNDAIAGSRLIIYEDAGHLPQEELPARSAGDLRSFLHAAFPETPAGAPIAAALAK